MLLLIICTNYRMVIYIPKIFNIDVDNGPHSWNTGVAVP